MADKKLADLEDQELDEHLAGLHEEQRAVLADIDAASREIEHRQQVQQEAALAAALPESMRNILEAASGVPAHVKHALVEARTAAAGTDTQDAEVHA